MDSLIENREQFSDLQMAKDTNDNDLPVLQNGAVNVFAFLPCALKVRFKQAFESFVEEQNQNGQTPVYCPTILNGISKDIAASMREAKCEDELPDILVTKGLNTAFSRDFKQKYLDTGIFTGLTEPEALTQMPADYKRIAHQYNIGFLAFGAWSVVADLSVEEAGNYPACWTDLARPEFQHRLALHGHYGQAGATTILLLLREREGDRAIIDFAKNIQYIRHFSELIKSIDSSDPQRVPFNILPNSAAVQIPSRKNAALIEFEEGPVMVPLLLFVKTSKLTACKPVLNFFRGNLFREILGKGDFHLPENIDWHRNFCFPSWDYLATRDFTELSTELDILFQQGLTPPAM